MLDGTLAKLPHADLTGRIIGVFLEVFKELGHGFSEAVYTRALAIALHEAGLSAAAHVPLKVWYHGECIGSFFPDLIVERVVLIEVKATATIEGYAQAQMLNYLKAAGGGVGLLLNFGRRAEFKRMVMGDPSSSLSQLRR